MSHRVAGQSFTSFFSIEEGINSSADIYRYPPEIAKNIKISTRLPILQWVASNSSDLPVQVFSCNTVGVAISELIFNVPVSNCMESAVERARAKVRTVVTVEQAG